MPDTPATPAVAPAAPAIRIEKKREFELTGDRFSVVRVPGTERLFVGGDTGRIEFVDLAEEKPAPVGWDAHVGHVSGLVLTAKHLISAGSDHHVVWWDRETRSRVQSVTQPKWVRHLALSPDGRILSSVCDDMVCRLWDAQTAAPIRELKGHPLKTHIHQGSKLYVSAFSPDGKALVTADLLGHAFVWDVATGRQLTDVYAPNFSKYDNNGFTYGGIRSVDFSPDGRLVAFAGNAPGELGNILKSQSLIQVFDWQAGTQVADCRPGGYNNFFFERAFFHHAGRSILGVGGPRGINDGPAAKPKLVLFDLEKQATLAEAELPEIMFDAVLSKNPAECVTAGRGRVCQWTITG